MQSWMLLPSPPSSHSTLTFMCRSWVALALTAPTTCTKHQGGEGGGCYEQ